MVAPNDTDFTVCPDCNKAFKNISRHKCKAKAEKAKRDEIHEKAKEKIDALNKIEPDRFWAWTEGFGVQMGEILRKMDDIKNALANNNKLLRDQLFAINESIADVLDPKQKKPKTQEEEDLAAFEEMQAKEEKAEFKSADQVETKGTKTNGNIITIEGIIQGETERALLIDVDGKENWFPKSTIKSMFESTKDVKQTFECDKWILKKHGLVND